MKLDTPAAATLRSLLGMSAAEVASRRNAWPEVVAAATQVLDEALLTGGLKRSSEEAATIASAVLQVKIEQVGPAGEAGTTMSVATLLAWAQTLAGSVLSQREPQEGAEEPLPQLFDDPQAPGKRALLDAQLSGQAKPLVNTVVIGAVGATPTDDAIDITTHDDAARGERRFLEPRTGDMSSIVDAERSA